VRHWVQIRAGLIALAIGIGLVEGCPLPGKPAPWQRGVVEPLREVQAVVLTPVAWVRPWLRISQRWRLFDAPSVHKHRLWIEGRDLRGTWHLLFRAGDPEHQEDAWTIDYSRPRGSWAPPLRPPLQYPLFAAWMTQRVLDRHPDYTAARIQLEKVELTRDGMVPTGQFEYVHLRERVGPPRATGGPR
jgi:hypothetical protein